MKMSRAMVKSVEVSNELYLTFNKKKERKKQRWLKINDVASYYTCWSWADEQKVKKYVVPTKKLLLPVAYS